MFLDLLSHECVLYEYLVSRRTRVASWHWHALMYHKPAVGNCCIRMWAQLGGTIICMQQSACATKGMWALAKAPERFYICDK